MTDSASKRAEKPESTIAKLIAPRESSRLRLAIFAAIVLAWIAILIILYFTTVRPLREHTPQKAIVRATSSGIVL